MPGVLIRSRWDQDSKVIYVVIGKQEVFLLVSVVHGKDSLSSCSILSTLMTLNMRVRTNIDLVCISRVTQSNLQGH